jgi:hypothetical protein
MKDKFRSSPSESFVEYHGNHTKEWMAFQIARSLNEDASLKSISMGLGQIMGFNYNLIGYSSANAMFNNMSNDIKSQLDGFSLILINANTNTRTPCIDNLKTEDYIRFANCYNASGQDKQYGTRLKEAADTYKELTSGRQFGA